MTYLDKLIEAVKAGEFLLDAIPARYETTAYQAFSGSLDAAKALHDALLPGWGYRVSPCYAAVMHPSVTGNDVTKDAVVNDNPARAWLLAILKAYREETQK